MELDIAEGRIDRAHTIGKKIPGRVKPIIDCFRTWCLRTMVYRKRKDCINCSITLDLMKVRMDRLKEVSIWHHIRYVFKDINCSLLVKLTNGSFKFFNTIDDLNNYRVLYLFLAFALIWESVWFWEFLVIFHHFIKLCWYFLKVFYSFLTFFYIFLFLLSSANF